MPPSQPVATPPVSASTRMHSLRWKALGTECFVQCACDSSSVAQAFGRAAQAWVEQFAAAGAASGTLTLNYLNANTGAAKSGVIALQLHQGQPMTIQFKNLYLKTLP